MKTARITSVTNKTLRKKSFWYKLVTTIQIIWVRVLGLSIGYRGYVIEYDRTLEVYQCFDPVLKLNIGCINLHQAKEFCKENKVGED